MGSGTGVAENGKTVLAKSGTSGPQTVNPIDNKTGSRNPTPSTADKDVPLSVMGGV